MSAEPKTDGKRPTVEQLAPLVIQSLAPAVPAVLESIEQQVAPLLKELEDISAAAAAGNGREHPEQVAELEERRRSIRIAGLCEWARQQRPTDDPIPLYQVLMDEYVCYGEHACELVSRITQRREELKNSLSDTDQIDAQLLAEVYAFFHKYDVKRSGLCLSGGGIRSATFNLGILQGLARLGALGGFDFLSTVSGGGYVGGWLSAWLHRAGSAKVLGDLGRVQSPSLEAAGSRPPTPAVSPIDPEPEPVKHLRAYSRYLSPHGGVLSADTWTLVAIYLRNLFLNWLVLLPLLASALIVPRLLNRWNGLGLQRRPAGASWLFGVAILAGAVAALYMLAARPGARAAGFPGVKHGQAAFLWWCLLPLVISAWASTTGWAWLAGMYGAAPPAPVPWLPALSSMAWWVVLALAIGSGGFLISLGWRWREAPWAEGLMTILVGVLAGLLTGWVARPLSAVIAGSMDKPLAVALYTCLAVPAFLSIFLLAAALWIGLCGSFVDDADREWMARAGAWTLIAIVGWIVICGATLFGPVALTSGMWHAWLAGAVGSLSSLVTVLLGRSGKTGATRSAQTAQVTQAAAGSSSSSLLSERVLRLAAPLAVLAVLATVSLLTHQLLRLLVSPPAGTSYDPGGYLSLAFGSPTATTLGALLALGLLGTFAGFLVNVNWFSLHASYRNRLIRAYLGASSPGRQANCFTGFDERDNLGLTQLRGLRPFHLLNLTLNLVNGKQLAWQDRKAEPFTASPLHCGSFRLGYRDSSEYGYHRRTALDRARRQPPGAASGRPAAGAAAGRPRHTISLGTAVAISGAAASPNMGYHSSPVVAFLMTLFNVRLGWWLGNPGRAGASTYDRPGPGFGPRALLSEALGLTDDRGRYVYLSDGGHFENLGLYELVLRRCRYILVSDATQDSKFTFGDLANALAKIRIDLGVPIELDSVLMRPRSPDEPFYQQTRIDGGAEPVPYFAVGTIRYSCVDRVAGMTERELGDQDGLLVYIKPSLNGTEPLDVLHFARESPPFPHEATEHVLFSESQFESYRALGSHIVDRFFPGGAGGAGARDVPALVQRFADHLRAQATADRAREPGHGTGSPGSPPDGAGGPGGGPRQEPLKPPPGGNGSGERPAA
jgi:hypothetical protein